MNNSLYRGHARIMILIALISLTLLSACTKKESPQKPADKVSIRLKWIHQGQFAGFYIAQEKGFFKENNIDVTIRAGGQDLNAIKLVASGSDTFGVWGADQLLIAREKEIPVSALAVIYPKSPVCWTSLKKSNIKEPKDFIGRKIGFQYGTNHETEYIAMLNNLKIDRKLIKEIPVQFNFQQLLEGQVEAWPSYIINEPILAREKGFEVDVISPSDYGVKMYADTLFTTDELIKKNPDLVKRVVNAVLKGWAYAIEHPEEAADAVLKYDDKLNRTHELNMVKAAIPLVKPSSDYRIGWMDKTVWEAMKNELLRQKILDKDVNTDEVFTMDFLK